MTDTTDHLTLGRRLYNATWDLLEAEDERTETQDLEMLLTAAASRWHWGQVDHVERPVFDMGLWQVARVLAELGAGALSLRFATAALESVRTAGLQGWALASAHEGVARAHHVCGDVEARDRHEEAARRALDDEPAEDARQVIEQQLASIRDLQVTG